MKFNLNPDSLPKFKIGDKVIYDNMDIGTVIRVGTKFLPPNAVWSYMVEWDKTGQTWMIDIPEFLLMEIENEI